LTQPNSVAGVKQDPLQGISLAYSIDNAKAPARHKVQYYEINGTRSIYQDGWKAATLHKPGTPFEQDKWELNHISEDPTEINDLATQEPSKLNALKALFEREGKNNHVFPLKDTLFKRFYCADDWRI
jgi:arylsulfatase